MRTLIRAEESINMGVDFLWRRAAPVEIVARMDHRVIGPEALDILFGRFHHDISHVRVQAGSTTA